VNARLRHYSRRFAMDVDHLGIAVIEQLTKAKLVKDVADLYTLTEEQVAALERHGEKSAKNLITSIKNSKERTLDRLITGLGVPQVGQVAARQLAEEGETLARLRAMSAEDLRTLADNIHGFGPKMVDCVVKFFSDPAEQELMDRLIALDVGRAQPRAKVAAEGPLVGKSFCVTGVLTEKRETVHEKLRAAGATIHDSVKKNTTYLVAGDKTGKTKLDQAKKFGAEVITEARMNELLRG
jgi:DNA ligase (NAD+)